MFDCYFYFFSFNYSYSGNVTSKIYFYFQLKNLISCLSEFTAMFNLNQKFNKVVEDEGDD
jgi:hypothetical protein